MNPSADQRVKISLWLYRKLAAAFPQEFSNLYGRELLQTADDSIELIWRDRGAFGAIRLLWDVAVRIPAEYIREIRQDLHYGLRTLANSPGFTSVALISLTLGISIATCAISEMNGMVLRTLPGVWRPEELVSVLFPVSYPSFQRYQRETKLFSSTTAYIAPVPFMVKLNGSSQRSWGQLVSSTYFSTFGVNAYLGRTFDHQDDQPGRSPTIIVGYRYWQSHLNADPAIIGKTLSVNGHPATVIGVAPEEFLGASPFLFSADLWMPLSVGPGVAPELSDEALNRRDVQMFRVVARLQPGVTRDESEAALDAVTQQFEQDNAGEQREPKGRRLFLVEGGKMLPLRKQDQPFFTSFLLLIAALVVLIACANVANMMLARAMDRRREIAVRLSLGASRARLVRQLVTENMIIASAAGMIGFGLSAWLIRLLSQLRMPFPMPVAYNFEPDRRVLLFTMLITLSTGLLFGLAPALQATGTEITPGLKEGATVRLPRLRRLNLRNLLMISQMAGSLTLLVLLGVLSLGIQTTMGIQAGFNPQNLYLISSDPVRDGYPRERVEDFFRKLLERVQTSPGIISACKTETVPVSLPSQAVTVSVPNSSHRVLDSVVKHVVGEGYFSTTGIRLRMGRAFSVSDEANSSSAVVVSEAFVDQLWPGENPIGRSVEIGNSEIAPPKILPGSFDYRSQTLSASRNLYEIVGVVGNVGEGLVVQKPRPAIYFPLRSSDYVRPSLEGVTIIVRAAPGSDAIAAVRRQVAALSEQVIPFNAMTMREHIEQFMSPLRAAAWTYSLIGVFGLVLASVGLAGMTAYSVTQRRHELAVRMALGARREDVMRLVVKDGSYLVLIGTMVGMSCAWMGQRALSAMSVSVGRIESTNSSNPVVIIGAPLLLASLALMACYWPARKSTQINPVTALRQE